MEKYGVKKRETEGRQGVPHFPTVKGNCEIQILSNYGAEHHAGTEKLIIINHFRRTCPGKKEKKKEGGIDKKSLKPLSNFFGREWGQG